jgi:hypothetical protein
MGGKVTNVHNLRGGIQAKNHVGGLDTRDEKLAPIDVDRQSLRWRLHCFDESHHETPRHRDVPEYRGVH